ncbi:hypothetical protein ACNTMJ_27885 [Klebsiella pneumoniae]|uniref:hypothetical protein n=1 Tax=Klebsiella pneumoniae TaxID=573 RepID=UPI003EDB3B9A
MNILRSFTETVVTTSTDTFPISFEYDEKYDAVHVFLNDVAVEDLGYTVSQVNAVTLKVEPAISEGTVRIERETDIDKMKYIFDAGALFIDQNVDADFKQIVHSQQEVRDGFIKLRGDVLPLVHGLQESLKQAQEASEAAQEAANAAEVAAAQTQYYLKYFNPDVAYPLNARLMLDNGDIVKSTIANNTTNPNFDMTWWEYSDIIQFKTINDLIGFQSPKDGMIAKVKGYFAPENLALNNPFEGGGLFIYVSSKAGINNNGTIINGWVRQYSGDVDISWFGAQRGADASPFIESALKVSKSIVIRGNYTLETICGIPDQNNYSPTVISIRGENQATLTVNCPAGAVFTSAAGKLNPTSTSDIYTGKINVSGINFVGTTIANSVIFNGDRLYNMKIHHNNFHGNVTIIKAEVKSLANRSYSQSVDINNNHMAFVYRVIVADRAYNFNFSFNMCENCLGGIYIGVDAPFDPTGMSISIFRNLWEAGGLILKTNGGIVSGSISKNYFESNSIADAATDKCQIYINRTGAGAGYSSGLVFDSNFFSGSKTVTGYVDVRLINNPATTAGTTKGALTMPAVFIGNWSENGKLTDNPSAILIGNRVKDRELMLNAYTPQEARVSFFSGHLNKAVTTNPVRFMTIDTRPCLTNSVATANFKASMDVMLHFTTVGAVNTATVGFKLDLMVFAPYGTGTPPPKAGLKVSMSGFVQSSGADKITDTVQMGAVVSSPTIAVVDNGDGTYHLDLSTFANYSVPNWGNITNVRVTYNMQGSGYIPGSYSSLNLLGIS